MGMMRLFLTDEKGFITEAPTSNVFLVNQDDVFLTAPEDRGSLWDYKKKYS